MIIFNLSLEVLEGLNELVVSLRESALKTLVLVHEGPHLGLQ
jgi:hypothetical protein